MFLSVAASRQMAGLLWKFPVKVRCDSTGFIGAPARLGVFLGQDHLHTLQKRNLLAHRLGIVQRAAQGGRSHPPDVACPQVRDGRVVTNSLLCVLLYLWSPVLLERGVVGM